MLSRREAIVRTALAGLAAVGARTARVTAKAAQPRVPVAFDVPSGAYDCHVHIFDPDRFPFAAARTYTPEPAGIDELRALHRALHVERVVVVHPSVYGTDNSCSVNAVRQLGSNARGVAVIDDRTSDAELAELARSGIRGIRVNLMTAGVTDPAASRQRFEFAASRAKEHGWHIQMYTQLAVIAALHGEAAASPVAIVFDHFGGAQATGGMNQPGLDVLLGLVRSGTA